MNSPDPITTYFEAANAGQADAAAACFTEDGTVYDEGGEHRGPAMIRAWVEETTGKYQPRTEILGRDESTDRTLVTARVSGNFPGSPVELEFAFTLREGKISSLRIE
jgi:ketosteroid isomerase-like protein